MAVEGEKKSDILLRKCGITNGQQNFIDKNLYLHYNLYIMYCKGKQKMRIQLSDNFTYKKLFIFTIPSIAMMIFTSIYGVVDGYFVSNYVGKIPFAALNFIMPFLMILGTIGFMFGTGGSALISKLMGEGNKEKANSLFSLFIYIPLIIGVIISVLGIILLPEISTLLGAEGEMLRYSVIYGRIILAALPLFILQVEFQTFFITAEKPQLGLYVTLFSGVTNMVLDFLLVGVFSFGLEGAALATAISQGVGGIVPLVYFMRKNDSLLKLGKTEVDLPAIIKCCTNGSSELLSNISMSLIGMLYNIQLLKYAGENGIAAYGVLMYVNFVFLAAFIGYSIGIAPIVSFNLGSANHKELKNIFRKSMVIIGILSVVMFVSSEFLAKPLSIFFVGYDEPLLELTKRGFLIYSFSFLFAGFAGFGSAFFTALNNGLISAILSVSRTLVFQILAVLLLPLIFGIDGIWISVVIAEFLATILTIIFIIANKKRYHY